MPSRRTSFPVACRLVAVGLWAGTAVLTGDQTVVGFDKTPVGAMPPGWQLIHSSAENPPGQWRVERVDGFAVLSQVATYNGGYQLALLESPGLRNLRAGVRVKRGAAGDGAAGLAWRVQDAGNYYAARLDLEEREFVQYKFVRGNRITMERVDDLRLDERTWHDLAVSHVGERFTVWLNGIPVATERDRSLMDAGRIGLWVPSDSTAHFTGLWYEPVDGR